MVYLGTRIKRIIVWQGLKAFCDNKLNITHECWNTTFVCTCTHRDTCKASGVNCTAGVQSHRNRLVSFQRTDGCQEYTSPKTNDVILINLTNSETELSHQAAVRYFGSCVQMVMTSAYWTWLISKGDNTLCLAWIAPLSCSIKLVATVEQNNSKTSWHTNTGTLYKECNMKSPPNPFAFSFFSS